MSKTYTLGGNRLGTGKQRKVSVKAYERSTHDLSHILRDTINCGTLVPFYCNVATSADTWDIDLRSIIRTMPTNGPLFGSFKFQADMFMVPMRLYHGLLHNNALNIGKHMEQVIWPTLALNADFANKKVINPDWQMVHPSSLLSHFGIKGCKKEGTFAETEFNALPIISYYDIFKTYYANTQEENAYVITPAIEKTNPIGKAIFTNGDEMKIENNTTIADWALVEYYFFPCAYNEGLNIEINGDIIRNLIPQGYVLNYHETSEGVEFQLTNYTTAPKFKLQNVFVYKSGMQLSSFPLENIDTMRKELLKLEENEKFELHNWDEMPYYALTQLKDGEVYWNSFPMNGLVVKTYQSDIYNNWLNTEAIDEVNELTAINTEDGEFTINEFLLMYKTWEMLNAVNVAGGTYKDYLEVNYDETLVTAIETPMYVGGMSGEIVFEEVVSTADVTQDNNASQALGTIAGKGQLVGEKGGKITINVKEPCFIIGIMSITPRVDYNQGNKWWAHRIKTAADIHKPALDEIGFEDLLTCEMHWGEQKHTLKSAGKIPAWSHYTTDTNETLGDFADTLDFMVLNRHYDYDDLGGIRDVTTYIDPRKYNLAFANADLEAMNFWVQIEVAATVRRKMSARVMPHL